MLTTCVLIELIKQHTDMRLLLALRNRNRAHIRILFFNEHRICPIHHMNTGAAARVFSADECDRNLCPSAIMACFPFDMYLF